MFSLKSICLVASLGSIGPIAAFAAGQAVIHVPAGGDLQGAINSAQLGDTVTLEPGSCLYRELCPSQESWQRVPDDQDVGTRRKTGHASYSCRSQVFRKDHRPE